MEARDGLPGRSKKVFAAVRRVRRMFQTEERVYSSLIIAKSNSTATRVSCSVKGGASFRGLLGSGGLVDADIEDRLGDCSDGVVLVDVLVVAAMLSVREWLRGNDSAVEP